MNCDYCGMTLTDPGGIYGKLCPRCYLERERAKEGFMGTFVTPDLEKRHYTFHEDENPEPMAGYKGINLNAFFAKYPELIEWHDRITKRGSFGQKIGIPNWRVVAAWKAMLEHRMQDEDMRRQGFIKQFWRLSGTFFRYFHRFWYEGPVT